MILIKWSIFIHFPPTICEMTGGKSTPDISDGPWSHLEPIPATAHRPIPKRRTTSAQPPGQSHSYDDSPPGSWGNSWGYVHGDITDI